VQHLCPEIQHLGAPRAWYGLVAITFILTGAGAHAHVSEGATEPPAIAAAWTLDPWLLAPLAVAALAYAAGLVRAWRRAGVGRGLRRWEAGAGVAGFVTLFFALVWPLDALGEWSLAVHMAQHMLLLAVAAPLLVLGRPLLVGLASLPRPATRRVARALKAPLNRRALQVATGTTAAALLQAAVMWGWHVPAAMDLALVNDAVHYAMHASFLGAGLVFWAALVRSLREPRAGFGAGAGAVALVGTMAQMGLLSALLTFAPTSRFGFYEGRAEMMGLTPLEDQQLAGLIMWVPSAVPYLLGAVLLMAAWLRRAEWQDERNRASPHDSAQGASVSSRNAAMRR
jgi:putative membrane protein